MSRVDTSKAFTFAEAGIDLPPNGSRVRVKRFHTQMVGTLKSVMPGRADGKAVRERAERIVIQQGDEITNCILEYVPSFEVTAVEVLVNPTKGAAA